MTTTTETTVRRGRHAADVAADALVYAAQAAELAGTSRPPKISGAAISALLKLGPGAGIITDPSGSRPRPVASFDEDDWTVIVLLTYGEARATCKPAPETELPSVRPVDLGAELTAEHVAAAARGAW